MQLMKILVIGAGGMLGHKLCQILSEDHEVFGGVRGDGRKLIKTGILDVDNVISGFDALDFDLLDREIARISPDVICNAVGLIKQKPEAKLASRAVEINSLLPYRLVEICEKYGSRVMLFSTDCVFDGKKGGYTEGDVPNAQDLYGRTKALGEVDASNALVIRSSIVGRQLEGAESLFEWFISQSEGKTKGFKKAIYSGLTTLEMSRLVNRLVTEFKDLNGTWNVSSDPIDKFSLLKLVNDRLKLGIGIEPEEAFEIDRSLDSSAFRSKTGYMPPDWNEMIREFAEDSAVYDKWRKVTS